MLHILVGQHRIIAEVARKQDLQVQQGYRSRRVLISTAADLRDLRGLERCVVQVTYHGPPLHPDLLRELDRHVRHLSLDIEEIKELYLDLVGTDDPSTDGRQRAL